MCRPCGMVEDWARSQETIAEMRESSWPIRLTATPPAECPARPMRRRSSTAQRGLTSRAVVARRVAGPEQIAVQRLPGRAPEGDLLIAEADAAPERGIPERVLGGIAAGARVEPGLRREKGRVAGGIAKALLAAVRVVELA